MADYPSLPLFTDAYMRDCWHLSDAEHGRYLLFLMLIWQSPNCRVPNDPEWIARKMKRTIEEYHSGVEPLVKEFCKNSGNWITQKRLTREYFVKRKTSKSQSDRAKARATKDIHSSPRQAGTEPGASTRQASGTATLPYPSLPSKGVGNATHSVRSPKNGAAHQPDDKFDKFWLAYPKREGANPRKTAKAAFSKALKRGADPELVISQAHAFAEFVRAKGKERTEFVPMAATWLNQDRWTETHEQPGGISDAAKREFEAILYGPASSGGDGGQLHRNGKGVHRP